VTVVSAPSLRPLLRRPLRDRPPAAPACAAGSTPKRFRSLVVLPETGRLADELGSAGIEVVTGAHGVLRRSLFRPLGSPASREARPRPLGARAPGPERDVALCTRNTSVTRRRLRRRGRRGRATRGQRRGDLARLRALVAGLPAAFCLAPTRSRAHAPRPRSGPFRRATERRGYEGSPGAAPRRPARGPPGRATLVTRARSEPLAWRPGPGNWARTGSDEHASASARDRKRR